MMNIFSQLTQFYDEYNQLKIENSILKERIKHLEGRGIERENSSNDIKLPEDFLVSIEDNIEEESITDIEQYFVEPPSPTKSDVIKIETKVSEPETPKNTPLPSEDEEVALFNECVKDGVCGCEGSTFKSGKRRGKRPFDLFAFKVHYKKSKHHQQWYQNHKEKFNSINISSPGPA
jgi:hypothetical protein